MICSKVNWKSILWWKLTRINKSIEHRSDIAVYRFDPKAMTGDYLLWLGHATFYLRLNNRGILFNPVFGDIPFHRRLTPLPLSPQELAVDVVLISHGHFDHLDLSSLRYFDVPIVVPEGLGCYIQNKEIIELRWWEEVVVEGVKITALPAKHWHQRGLFDKNSAFWCSFLVEQLYFAGDSAYYTHFKQIGRCYDVRIALLPIGAYEPSFIMQENHLTPEQAYQAFLDLQADIFVPYHFGTFVLSDEPVDEPLRRIEAIEDERIRVLSPGLALIL